MIADIGSEATFGFWFKVDNIGYLGYFYIIAISDIISIRMKTPDYLMITSYMVD